MALTRTSSFLSLFLGLFLLAGCGAVFINQGSRNNAYAENQVDPNASKQTSVPESNRVVADFENGTKAMNSILFGAGLGSFIAYSPQGVIPFNFVSAGGANGTKMAAHVNGTLWDRGNGVYSSYALLGRFKTSGYFDASAFQGIKFYYKCPSTDRAPRRRFGLAIASTAPVALGGVCQQKCGNDYGANLKPTSDWQEMSYNFTDLKREEGWGESIDPPDFTDHLKEIIYIKWDHGTTNVAGTYNVDYWVDEVEFF